MNKENNLTLTEAKATGGAEKRKEFRGLLVPATSDWFITHDALVRRPKGGEETTRLPVPRVVAVETCADAPLGMKHTYTVRVGDDEQTLSTKELQDSAWPDSFAALQGSFDRKTREMYANAIHLLSSSEELNPHVERIYTRTRTGFHSINCDGQTLHGYLTDNYFITGRAAWPYELRLKDSKREQLEAAPSFPAKQRKKVIQSLIADLQSITPDGHLLVGLMNNFCALFNYLRPQKEKAGHSLMIYGGAGGHKSSIAAAIRSAVYDYDFNAGFDDSFRSSPSHMQSVLDMLADVPTVFDNFREEDNETAHASKQKYQALEMIVEAAQTRAPIAGRSRRDGTARAPKYVRSLPIITGEFVPINAQDSFFRRVLIMELQRGEVEIESTSERRGLKHVYSIEHLLKGLHAHAAQYVVDVANNGNAPTIAAKLEESTQAHYHAFTSELADLHPHAFDVREQLCRIAAHIMSAACLLDGICGTGRSAGELFASATFPALVAFLRKQVEYINTRHGRAMSESLIDDILRRFFDALGDGLFHEGQRMFIYTMPDKDEDADPRVYSSDERQDGRFGFRADQLRRVDAGWYDRDGNRLIVGNLLQKQLARIATEICSQARVGVNDVYALLEKAGYVSKRSNAEGKHVVNVRLRGCARAWASGWQLDARKVLYLVEATDERAEA